MSADSKWALEERKLSQVYDDLNEHEHKLVQTFLDRYLKKNPNSQPALALYMALAQQMAQGEDAVLGWYNKVLKTGPLSTRSSSVILYALKIAGRYDLCLEVHMSMVEAHPEQIQLSEQALFCAAAADDMDTMATLSRIVYNKIKDPRFARLGAWGNLQLYRDSPTGENSIEGDIKDKVKIANLLLTMANRQQPVVWDTTQDILSLNVEGALAAGNHAAALKIVRQFASQGDLHRVTLRMDTAKKVLDELEGSEREEEAAVELDWICEFLARHAGQPANYAFCTYLLDLIAILPSRAGLARRLLTTLHAARGKPSERSFIYAILDLDTRIPSEYRLDRQKWDQALDVYWDVCGGKPACVAELQGVTREDDAKRAKMLEVIETQRQRPIATAEDYRRSLVVEKIWALNRSSDWLPEIQDVEHFWNLYLLPSKQKLPGLPPQDPTDVYPGDDAGFVAIHLLVLLWTNNKTDGRPLLTAMACLCEMLKRSSPSGPANFLAVRLARLIGADGLIPSKWLGEGGPNEIQLDTLLHTVVERASGEAYAKTMSPNWPSTVEKAEKMYQRAIPNVAEQLVMGLQWESYSTTQGMLTAAKSLQTSLEGGITRIERTRLTLLSGNLPSTDRLRHLERLVGLAESGRPMTDLRDWDLMPGLTASELSQLPGLRILTTLGEEIQEGWVAAWGAVILAVARYLSGQPAVAPELPGQCNNCLPAEKTLLEGLKMILGRIAEASTPLPKEQSGSGQDPQSLKGLFDPMLASTPDEDLGISRWAKLYNVELVVELSRLLERIHKKVEAAAQTTGTGKNKKKAEARIVALAKELGELRDEVKTKSEGALGSLEQIANEDEGVSPDEISLPSLEGLTADTARDILAQRKTTVDNLRKLLV